MPRQSARDSRVHDIGSDAALVEEAAGWLISLKDMPNGASASKEFEAWLATSTDHRRAWERVNATWAMLGAGAPSKGIERPLARHGSVETNRTTRANTITAQAAAGQTRYRPYRAVAAIAAGFAVAAILAFGAPNALVRMNADHATAVGKTDQVRLADGTVVDLGGNSAIKLDTAAQERFVTLLAGEAFFDVAPDPVRPFVVNAGGVELRVLGTAFDVQMTSTSTTVALLRGSVEVRPSAGQKARRLSPGERLEVDHDSGAVTIDTVSPENIGGWRQGRVFLTDVSLGTVVEMIQRYHPAWISIPDQSLAAVRVSGLFDLTDPDGALTALVKPFGAKVRSVTPYVRVLTRS